MFNIMNAFALKDHPLWSEKRQKLLARRLTAVRTTVCSTARLAYSKGAAMVGEQALQTGAHAAYAARGLSFRHGKAMRSRMPRPVGTLFRVV